MNMKINYKYFWILLLAVLWSSQPLFAWQWGSEGDLQCPWNEPEGTLGCDWFNNGNGWVSNNPVTFANWNNRRVSKFPLCFTGALATICYHNKWPKTIHLKGYLRRKSVAYGKYWI